MNDEPWHRLTDEISTHKERLHDKAERARRQAEQRDARRQQVDRERREARDLLWTYLEALEDKSPYVRIDAKKSLRQLYGDIKLAILVDLEDKEVFRQPVTVSDPTNSKDLGILFEPDTRFSSLDRLREYLDGPLTDLLAEAIGYCEYQVGLQAAEHRQRQRHERDETIRGEQRRRDKPCLQCRGSGRMGASTCDRCHGTGEFTPW